jgi:hypothetical protein
MGAGEVTGRDEGHRVLGNPPVQADGHEDPEREQRQERVSDDRRRVRAASR